MYVRTHFLFICQTLSPRLTCLSLENSPPPDLQFREETEMAGEEVERGERGVTGGSQTARQWKWHRRECWVKTTKDWTVQANSYTQLS